MPFNRPTLSELKQRAAGDLNSNLSGTDALLRRSNTNVLATVQAGTAHGLYGRLEFMADQLMPDKAEKEYLDRWASIWGVSRKAADFAAGPTTVTGIDGSIITKDEELQRADGIVYVVQADAVIAAGTATLQLKAQDAGSAGNTPAGSQLSFINPVDGVDSEAVAGEINGGIDEEGERNLLVRLLRRIQYPPHAGADFDYVDWALEIPGVTRAWCLPNWLGPLTVGVTFVCDDQAGSIVPGGDKVAEVAAYIERHVDPNTGKMIGRPTGAEVYVFAPVLRAHDLTIKLTPNTPAIRSAVNEELIDLYRRQAEPGGIIKLSWVNEAISVAAGETDHKILSMQDDFRPDKGEIITLGAITWA